MDDIRISKKQKIESNPYLEYLKFNLKSNLESTLQYIYLSDGQSYFIKPIYFGKNIRYNKCSKNLISFCERAKIKNPEKYEELKFGYQCSCFCLFGIEELINLKHISIQGALADMTSLSKCRKLISIYISDACMINDLEELLFHKTLKNIKLGPLTNYNKEEFDYLVDIFNKRGIILEGIIYPSYVL